MNALPETFSLGDFGARLLSAADMGSLQALAEADPEYFEITAGGPPAADEAEQLVADLPPGKTHDDKFLYGLFGGDALTGVVELIRDYPGTRHWYLGLLFADPRYRNGGHGARIMADLFALLGATGAKRLRLAVIERNVRALRFWQRMGFTEERRVKRQVRPNLSLSLLEMGRDV